MMTISSVPILSRGLWGSMPAVWEWTVIQSLFNRWRPSQVSAMQLGYGHAQGLWSMCTSVLLHSACQVHIKGSSIHWTGSIHCLFRMFKVISRCQDTTRFSPPIRVASSLSIVPQLNPLCPETTGILLLYNMFIIRE